MLKKNIFNPIYKGGLYLLSVIYLLLLWLWQVKSRYHSQWSDKNCFVISCGNILVGGSGKSPLVCWFIEFLSKHNINPAVLTRGYKRDNSNPQSISPNEEINDWKKYGDEPVLIHRKHPNTTVYVNADRIASAKKAVSNRFLILDDGFQQLKLHKDLNLVLFDAGVDLEQLKLLPLGRLREPLSALKRTHAAILTKTNLASTNNIKRLEEIIASYDKSLPIFKLEYQMIAWQDFNGNRLPLDALKDKSAIALSAIANPKSFEKSLKKCQVKLIAHHHFNDHHDYQENQLKHLFDSPYPILTTEKDAVKLERFKYSFNKIFVLESKLVTNDAFNEFIWQKLSPFLDPKDNK